MFNPQQINKRRDDLFDRKTGQCVFVTHHQHLTHFDDRLQLLSLVSCGLQALQELLGFGGSWENKVCQVPTKEHFADDHKNNLKGLKSELHELCMYEMPIKKYIMQHYIQCKIKEVPKQIPEVRHYFFVPLQCNNIKRKQDSINKVFK